MKICIFAMLLFKTGEWSFYLISSLVRIVDHHYKYMWGGRYYVFTLSPLGLATAPYVFTGMAVSTLLTLVMPQWQQLCSWNGIITTLCTLGIPVEQDQHITPNTAMLALRIYFLV